MAHIHPFRAWRPKADKIEEAACVPYDVIDSSEARQLADGKPFSFLHVIRPEIDLSEQTSLYDDAVYEQGARNLDHLLHHGPYIKENEVSVYVYRLIMNGRSQTGLFTCVSVSDYDNNVILKHELTRPDKEDDRTRHILTQQAHAEPVMLTYRGNRTIRELTEAVCSESDPLYDFTADDGVRHTIWKSRDPDAFVKSFEKISKLYVADGHHRCKSASRAAEEIRNHNTKTREDGEYAYFPAVLFPVEEMKILAYNRIIHHVPDNFIQLLSDHFKLVASTEPEPVKKGDISIYMSGRWSGLHLPETEKANSVENLDVSRLQTFILEPLLNIVDQRRDQNISFVGGIRGTAELERLVDNGKADLAISMYPTSIEELLAVSDEGLLMPPKSTWFEPKLRSGILIHTF